LNSAVTNKIQGFDRFSKYKSRGDDDRVILKCSAYYLTAKFTRDHPDYLGKMK